MRNKLTIKDHHQEIRLFIRRLVIVAFLVAALAGLLLSRLMYLQIEEHQKYTTLSEQNQLSLLPIAPKRGLIYDRHGILVAQNVPVFSLEIAPEKIKNLQDTLQGLQNLIPISNEELERFHKQMKQRRKFEAVPLKFKLNDEELALFYVNQHLYPGVTVEAHLLRYYPLGEMLVDVLGYVGRINEKELKNLDPSIYSGTQFIGKLGIERSYEEILLGKVGYQQAETDASGKILRILDRQSPTPGNDLYLTIDTKLQIACKEFLDEKRGAIVAIDPNNGEVLAMTSNPGYDPNLFVKGMNNGIYQALQHSSDRPLFNRALRGQYAMASTIKPFLALGALAEGVTDTKRKILDNGVFMIPNLRHQYRDWKKDGHGWTNLHKAIVISCDIYFYDLAYKMGINRINKILRSFAFGDKTGIDLVEELPGLVPNPKWKMATQGYHWFPGDTVLSGIGQGYMLTTPLQLATAVSGMAMHGHYYHPHLLLKQETPDKRIIPFEPVPFPEIVASPKDWEVVHSGMRDVIRWGTARGRFGVAPFTAAGKTGTAQLYRNKDVKKKDIPEHLRDNTLFIVFAPIESPEIAVAVIVENEHSAPVIARKVLDKFFELKKARLTNEADPQPLSGDHPT